jgi:rhodanese-related sulfurtransferase
MSPLLFLALSACAPTPTEAAPSAASPAAPAAAPAAAAQEVRNADVAALQAALTAKPSVIDVRTPEEFAGGHVPGALNVPMDRLDQRMAELGGPGAEMYVICEAGGRSAKASATLASKGLRPINVLGGTAAWRAAGYPVE